MKVELSEEAHAQVQEIDAWWRENRRAAPDLFADELDQALLMLEQQPMLGTQLYVLGEHFLVTVAVGPLTLDVAEPVIESPSDEPAAEEGYGDA